MAEFGSWKGERKVTGKEKRSGILIFHCRESGNWSTDDSRSKAIYILFNIIKVTNKKTKNECYGGKYVEVVQGFKYQSII